MKLWLQNRTPVQLLWLIAAWSTLTTASYGALAFLPWRYPARQYPLFWGAFILLIASIAGSLLAEQALQNGISSERWPDRLLDRPRKLFTHPALSVLNALFLAASFAFIIFYRGHRIGGAWIFLWPAMCLGRVSNYLRPKPVSTDNSLLRIVERPKPLQSEHWGTSSHSAN